MAHFCGQIKLGMGNLELQMSASILGLPNYTSAKRRVFNSLIHCCPTVAKYLNEWNSGKIVLAWSKVVLLWESVRKWKTPDLFRLSQLYEKICKTDCCFFSSCLFIGLKREVRVGWGMSAYCVNQAGCTKQALCLLEGLKAIKLLYWQFCFLLK